MGKRADDLERRIAALEIHITDLEDRLNERGIFSGDLCTVPGNPSHLWQAACGSAEESWARPR